MKTELDIQLDEGISLHSTNWGWEGEKEFLLLAGLRQLHIPSFSDDWGGFVTTGSKKVEEWGKKNLKSL